MTKKQAKILIIAGSDPSGGAGLQADIKTANAHKIYAAAIPTCLTAQNTLRVLDVFYPPISFLQKQLEEILDDIKFDAIKIGMLGNAEIIRTISHIISKKAKTIPLILDTVMVATSGDLLLKKDAIDDLKKYLIEGAYLVTPNLDEAQVLADMPIYDVDDMKIAAIKIKKLGAKNVLIKGGHLKNKEDKIKNILFDEKNNFHLIANKKVAVKNIHGTGCTLASAIACNIALEYNLVKAVTLANNYVYKAALSNLKIGKGSHVLKHFV